MDLYFDCFSGISGDMTLGAFVDLGVPVDYLKTELSRIPLEGFDITSSSVAKHGIRATHVVVHDGHDHHHDHGHDHPAHDAHHHGHQHDDHHHPEAHHHGEHRHPGSHDHKSGHKKHHSHGMNYAKIKDLIEHSHLSDNVKGMSLAIFEKIAIAESKIHGCPIDKIHFHEVGGIDAMVDIVGTALCVEYLNIETIYASPIPLGSGFTRCAHGTIPIPAPATAEILKGIPVYGSHIKQELVTPTGAAIITTLARSFGSIPPMVISQTAYGAGTKDNEERPNLLRVLAGDFTQKKKSDTVIIMETTIDDMNPEHFGYVMDRLFEDGALDVTLQPVFMKKNRPGTILSVLCREDKQEELAELILSETTSTGVRLYPARRKTLDREAVSVMTRFGDIPAKKIIRPDGSVHITPEFEACRKLAREMAMPLYQVYDEVTAAVAKERNKQ